MKVFNYCIILIIAAFTGGCQPKNEGVNRQDPKTSEAKIFNIKSYGAIGDSITMDTKSIQNAIDDCNSNGGGKIWIPAGKYQIGTIWLKSNITLSLDHGAELLGSQDLKDYPIDKLRPAREGQSECLLYAEDATNIRLEGLGVIDGRGTKEYFPRNSGPGGKDNRPRLLRFENCENVTFSGLTYKNPAFWGLHLIDCKNIHFDAVTIKFRNNNDNNDGIDIDGCEDVLIENCNINSGDDAVCLKSSLNPCKNIDVRNCILSSNTAPVKFGASGSGGFIDVTITNCYFYDSPMGAIKLELVDGGRMENVNISRIVMENVGNPIFIRLGNRGRIFTDRSQDTSIVSPPVGSIKNIRISNVVAEVTIESLETASRPADYKGDIYLTLEDRMSRSGPIMITGIPGHYVEDVVLENIKISYPGRGTEEYAKKVVPEDEKRYPEQFFFGVLPAWGAYIRHARNITFKNVTMTTRDPDQREMIILDDVEGFVNE